MSVAIIAEYNPFHNGHKYQLQQAQKLFPNEKIIIIMSGEYVQRGEIAVASFDERKKIAIQNGAHKVIELPFEYATQAAHIFAKGAIKLINKKQIDKIFFGSESNDPNHLMKIASAIINNKNQYDNLIKKYLKKNGNSFPKAASLALKDLIGTNITTSNDILGLEYCKAIIKNNFKIIPYTIKRTIDFHSEVPHKQYASASYIRKLFWEGQDYHKYTNMKLNRNRDRIENHYLQFQKIIKNTPCEILKKNKMISEGMENLFKKHIDANNMDEFIQKTNSKRYTSSRIKRTILYILKGIEK